MYNDVFFKIENNLKRTLYLFTHKDLDLDSYCSIISFANYIKNKYNVNVICILDIDSISYGRRCPQPNRIFFVYFLKNIQKKQTSLEIVC